MDQTRSVVEIVEARLKPANQLLAHGYSLLAIQTVTKPEAGPDGKGVFQTRRTVYVLGRPEEVPHWSPEKLTPPATSSENNGSAK